MRTIVLIEDNPYNARLAAKLLRLAGFRVLVAEDGETGLMTIAENRPDLVLVDLGLPDIDGQTIIAMLRQDESMRRMPIIAFTAWQASHVQAMAHAYGCDGVVTKPIDTRKFAAQVSRYLENTVTA